MQMLVQLTAMLERFNHSHLDRPNPSRNLPRDSTINFSLESHINFSRDSAQLHHNDVRARHRFNSAVYRAVRVNPRDSRGRTLLHIACDISAATNSSPCHSVPAVIASLLVCGSDVDAMDQERNTPLLIAANRWAAIVTHPTTVVQKASALEVIRVLMCHGAHLDANNKAGDTPAGLLLIGAEGLRGECDRPIAAEGLSGVCGGAWEMVWKRARHVSLKCLAARQVVKSGVEFHGCVPASLEAFIELH